MTVVEVTNGLAYDKFIGKRSEVTIISGNSCVQFTGDYRNFWVGDDATLGRRQTFNKEKSLECLPSADHVFDLDVGFPGTIVAVRFSLNPDAMEDKNGE